jgi:hypothetical protein
MAVAAIDDASLLAPQLAALVSAVVAMGYFIAIVTPKAQAGW